MIASVFSRVSRIAIIVLCFASQAKAQEPTLLYVSEAQDGVQEMLHETAHTLPEGVWETETQLKPAKEKKRVVAALLCVALGPFGVHRLYLGTSPVVPAAYTLTLGGGLGLLPLVDLGMIVFSKDLSRFENNPGVFMWNDGDKK